MITDVTNDTGVASFEEGDPHVLNQLDGVKRTRRGWIARCPAHSDRSPSLAIAQGTGRRVLLHCFAGCTYDDVAAALHLERWERTTAAPVSTLDVALRIASRQPWYRAESRLIYQIADAVRHHHQRAERLRRAVTIAGDTDTAWFAARRAADLDRDAECWGAELDEALA